MMKFAVITRPGNATSPLRRSYYMFTTQFRFPIGDTRLVPRHSQGHYQQVLERASNRADTVEWKLSRSSTGETLEHAWKFIVPMPRKNESPPLIFDGAVENLCLCVSPSQWNSWDMEKFFERLTYEKLMEALGRNVSFTCEHSSVT